MSKWSGKSKGFVFGYQIFILFIKKLGVPVSYLLLYFIVPLYYIFLHKSRKNLYLTFIEVPVLKNSNLQSLILKNFFNLGKTLVDNFAILTNNKSKYSYVGNGEEYLIDLINKSQPAILISAHIGSWSIAGELLKEKGGMINVVMYDGESKRIKSLVKKNIGENNYNIIEIKDDLSHLFKIKNAIDNKELICIHADRYIEGANTIVTRIFDKEVHLPMGPFAIVSKLNIPYSFVFCFRESLYRYQFSATKPELSKNPQIIANEFAEILSEKLSKHPEQWFNYFNIFEKK